jgi:hypothetical protein
MRTVLSSPLTALANQSDLVNHDDGWIVRSGNAVYEHLSIMEVPGPLHLVPTNVHPTLKRTLRGYMDGCNQ